MRFINSKLLGTLIAFSYGITAVVSLLAINSCGGKVANLSAASGSSYANLSFLSTDIYGIQVGVVNTGISTSGGFSPLVFSISGGALPVGLALDQATGSITGTIAPALAEKEYLVTILVSDAAALTVSKTFTGKIASGGKLLTIETKKIATFITGVSYMFPILSIGGTAPFKYSVYSGTLPTGIAIDPVTGVISGTPEASLAGQNYAFGVKVVDAEGQVSQSEIYMGKGAANPVGSVHLLTTELNGISVGAVVSGLATSGGASPIGFVVSAGTLPVGLTLNPLIGSITGTIGVGLGGTTYAFSVTVTDASGTSETKLYTGNISAGSSSLTLHTAAISLFTAGVAYSFPFTISGGYSPYVYAISSGTLPAGVTLDTATGIISGTPLITEGGQSYNFSFRVTDTSGQVQSRQFTGTVGANSAADVAIISTTLPGIAVGSITTGLSTSGGVAPLTFSLLNGALPSGLTLDSSTGVITGIIPVAAANTGYAAAIKVVDTTGSTDIKTFTGVVSPGNSVLVIASSSIANFAAGIAYSNPLIVTGGVAPFLYTIASGSLPNGIALNASTGVLSGTPLITSGGQPFSFTVNVADNASQSQSKAYSGSVIANSAAAIAILSTSLPGIGVGAVTTGITTAGGVPPLTFAISSGYLPTGLTLNTTTGIISGTIGVSSANAAYAVAISVTDSSSSSDLESFTGIVAAGTAVLTLNSTAISGFTAGISYSSPIVTTGGSVPYAFTITGGALPTGITISPSTGALSGTPALASGGASYTFTLTVTDASSQTQSRPFVGTVAANSAAAIAIVSTVISGMTVGAVSSGLSTSGGISPLVFGLTGGSLPPGLSLNTSTGSITGTIPVSAANLSYAAAISVTDAANSTASRTFSGTVSAGSSALVLNSTTVSPFIAGIPYSYPLVATNGVTPYVFSLSAGSLPAGLSLNTTSGVISGAPAVATANQAYGFTVTVTDAASQTKFQTFVGTVATSSAANLQITTTSIAAPTAASPYVAGISISGGTSPYVFTISSGTLPAGLSINTNTGVISGTPTHATKDTSFHFVGTVTDASNLTASVPYSGTISTYAPTLYPTSFAGGAPGALYSVTLATLGGQSPFTYAITSGTLPSGLSLNTSTGLISGTIAEGEAGLTKNVTVRSIDANSVQATSSYSIATSGFAISVTTTLLTNAVEMSSYSNNSTFLGASGGVGPYTFEYTGTLPDGVGLTSSGSFFGTPALNSGALASGTTYTIYVRARDALGVASGKQTLTLAVTISLPSVDSLVLSSATLGAPYSQSITASGGRSPYTFAVNVGSLPVGISLSSGGVLSGIASVYGVCSANQFEIRASDSLSQISGASVKCIATSNGVNITNTSLPPVVIGVNYNAALTVIGGTSPYAYTATALPAGVSINPSTGALAGYTNSVAGTYTSYLTVTDSNVPARSTTRTFSLVVSSALALTGTTISKGAALSPYGAGAGHQLNATGGLAPYTYAITAGALPSGLALSTSGLIYGTPLWNTAANGGAYSINVVATDALGQSTSAATFNLNIYTTPKILSSDLPLALLNSPYAYDIVRVGGSNPFNGSNQATGLTFSLASGSSLPTGLTLGSTTGRISGTPTSNGASPYTFTVEVTDAYGFKGSKSLTLTINSVAKTLDLKTARFSDPCLPQLHCSHQASDIALLTATTLPAAVSANTQQFLIMYRADTAPKSIQIAKIDSTGRVPRASTTALSINVPLPANIANMQYIKVEDFDQDGFKDIMFSDASSNTTQSGKQVCIMWNGGTVDSYGMPNSFSGTNIDCFAMPIGHTVANWPSSITVVNNLRPDSTNNGKIDVIVSNTMSNNNQGTFISILRNICPAQGNCTNATTQRPVIFDGFLGFTGTTNGTTTISAIASTANIQIGQPVVGVGIQINSRVTAVAVNSITISLAATTSLAGTKMSTPKAILVGATGTATLGSATVTGLTGVNASGIFAGQMFSHANFAAGTQVVSFTDTTIVASAVALGSSSAPLTAYGPVAHTPILQNSTNRYMRDVYGVGVGWFITAKPLIPSGVVGVNNCPGIAVAGFDGTNNNLGYVYVMRQTMSAGRCQGDFVTHINTTGSSDEWLAANNSPWLYGVVAEDFNSDGLTDIAVMTGAVQTASASVRVYLPVGGAVFTGGTQINPQLQSRNGMTVGATRAAAYCIDGQTTCPYPALVVEAGNGTVSTISVLPNQCSSPGCLTPFEPVTSALRIDYPAPAFASNATQNGQMLFKPLVSTSTVTPTAQTTVGSPVISSVSSLTGVAIGQAISGVAIPLNAYVKSFDSAAFTITINLNALSTGATTLSIPTVPSLLDLNVVGWDMGGNSTPYFLTYPRNGSSAADPFKGATMLDVFPAVYTQLTGVGTTRVVDSNSDGKLDLFAYAVNQGFVASYVTTASGGQSFNFGAGQQPNYLANPSENGCQASASTCFPDPLMNLMGVQQGQPNNNYYNANTMDVADINNDGISDVVVNGYASRGIAAAVGTLSGDFNAPILYDMGVGADFRPQSLTFSDLDQDGFQDIVLVGTSLVNSVTTGAASWLQGNGDGTFRNAILIPQIVNGCTDPRVVQAIDIDQDGRPELSVLCYVNQAVWVSRRNSSGVWVVQTNISINSGGGSNGVGLRWGRTVTSTSEGLDVAVVGLDGTNSLRIINTVALNLTNAGTGAFTMASQAGAYKSLFGYPSMVELSDLNGDGFGDVLIPMQMTNNNYWGGSYLTCETTATGAGNCNALGWGMEGYAVTSVSVGDVTSDGTPDLFVGFSSNNARVFYRQIARVLNTSY